MIKKFYNLILFFVVALVLCQPLFTPINCFALTQNYARIEVDNVYFFKAPIDNPENVYFELPKSYFVNLISVSNQKFYKAQYKDLVGYVKIDSVQCISGIPKTPFLNDVTFRVFSSDGAHLRSTPQQGDNIKATLDDFENVALEYYGKAVGEEVISKRGNIWYYCKHKSPQEEVVGYVYAGLCDDLTKITVNDETMLVSSSPFVLEDNLNQDGIENDNLLSLLVVLVCLPCFVLIYLLFKPKRMVEKANKKKFKRAIKQKIDFYEKPNTTEDDLL